MGSDGARCRTRTYDPVIKSPSAHVTNDARRASGVHAAGCVPGTCQRFRRSDALTLAVALRALADAGISPDSLVAAIGALLTAAGPVDVPDSASSRAGSA